jgi:carboxymethylenebutenolidase
MRKALIIFAAVSLCSVSLRGQDITKQEWAIKKLEKSPRHGEYVDIKHGDRTVRAYVVYPEASGKTAAVVVIHEIFGLTDWARLAADEVAEAGYIAIAPDLLSGVETGGNVMRAVSGLPPAQVLADLDATADYVKKLPSANGRLAVAGFCWGGGKSFAFATHRDDLAAAFVFYGPPPRPASDMAKIACPVYGFYGQNDNRIDATIPNTIEDMKQAGKKYDPVIYPGAGHGFMRDGDDPTPATKIRAKQRQANVAARDAAWKRFKDLLAKM